MHSFIRSFHFIHPSIHLSHICMYRVHDTIPYLCAHNSYNYSLPLSLYIYVRYVDGDKRCETFFDCQIGGGRWRVWVNEQAKQANSRSAWRERESDSKNDSESVNEQKPVNMCILYAWCVHLCVLYMLWSYLYFSRWKKKPKLFHIFVSLLTLVAVLFILENTTLTSIVHMSGVFLLFEWVDFFLLLRTQMKKKNN